MVESKNLGILVCFLVVGSAIYFVVNGSESQIPPTPSYSTITLNDTENTQGDELNSFRYDRQLKVTTDGSIILNNEVIP